MLKSTFKPIIFAFKYRAKISNQAFFYLLNGGSLPTLDYSNVCFKPNESYYIQSFLNKNKKFGLRIFTRYSLCPGLVLATKCFKKDLPTSMEDFYLDTLEGLAYYEYL